MALQRTFSLCRPFDAATYEDEVDDDEVMDEEGRTRLKLKVQFFCSASWLNEHQLQIYLYMYIYMTPYCSVPKVMHGASYISSSEFG